MTECTHARTGVVTSRHHSLSDESHAETKVCSLPECIAEALTWVTRVSGKPAFHVLDKAVES
jgi:hypothetical protein